MSKAKRKSEPSKLILRSAELWNEHNLSDNGIADKIMDEMGINLSSHSVTGYRRTYPELFEERPKAISREIAGVTHKTNKMLRSSKRMNVEKELAKLDAERARSANR